METPELPGPLLREGKEEPGSVPNARCKCPVSPSSFIAETVLTYLLYFGLVCCWRKELQSTSVFLPLESHEQYEKQKI